MKEGQPKPHYKKLLAWGAVSAENVARSSPHSRWHKRSPGMYDRRGILPELASKLGAIKPPRRD